MLMRGILLFMTGGDGIAAIFSTAGIGVIGNAGASLGIGGK